MENDNSQNSNTTDATNNNGATETQEQKPGEQTNSAGDKSAGNVATEGDNTNGAKAGEGGQGDIVYTDFAMPEGLQLDKALLDEATPIFKELGLSQQQAQKLVDFQAKQVAAGAQKQIDAFNQQLETWLTSAKSDKEYGGDKFDENIKLAQSAVNKFGTPELKQLLEDYGVGNHPEVIRLMVRVGKLTAEDGSAVKGDPVPAKKDVAAQLYPND